MKKEKWLFKEIDSWQQAALIDEATAENLKNRYSQKKNINNLIVLFSIIGSVLIGTGIILILAKNWQFFPLFLRVIIAYLPLAVSQSLLVFVVKTKYESLAWRESIAILVTASVFTVNVMVGQVFHLPGDYGTYVLFCGLLSLPVIYILNAVSPLLVYYWTVLNWAALEQSVGNALILIGLFSLGVLYLFFKRRQINARFIYMVWLTVISGFALTLIMGIMLECSLLLAVLCYFVLLLSIEKLPEQLLAPFKIIGTVGGLVTTAILTYEGMWSYIEFSMNIESGIMICIMLAASLYFTVKVFKYDKLKFLFIAALILLSILRFIWATSNLNYTLFAVISIGISNLILLSIGVVFIVHGVRNSVLTHTNIGMISVCALIMMRFFDTELDFFWRGIAFLFLGVIFLLVNLKIIRAKKQSKQEVQI